MAAQTGHTVRMVDLDAASLEKAQKKIADSLQRVVKKKFGAESEEGTTFINESIARITTSTDAVASVGSADLVVEAIVENLDVKKKLFAELDKVCMNCHQEEKKLKYSIS